jgi:hypothetical protein
MQNTLSETSRRDWHEALFEQAVLLYEQLYELLALLKLVDISSSQNAILKSFLKRRSAFGGYK